MRTLLIVLGLLVLIGLAPITGQIAPGAAKPSPAVVNPARDVSRVPVVVWKRGMSESVPKALPEDPSKPAEVPEARTPSPRTLTRTIPVAIPLLKPIPVLPVAPPTRTREQLMRALGSIQVGAPRSEVFAQLGQPAYSIAIPDGGHYIERCRFRAGLENLASIEMRDGYVIAIDRIAR